MINECDEYCFYEIENILIQIRENEGRLIVLYENNIVKDDNVFKVMRKVLSSLNVKVNIDIKVDIILNFLISIMKLDYISDIRLDRNKERVNKYLERVIGNEEDRIIYERIKHYQEN